jgi:alkanesulfonate monooxygenase SsuD/methylene tetrahydromethanopterin reductase-like flavin-dependent oxidoreductase (luciferase family)
VPSSLRLGVWLYPGVGASDLVEAVRIAEQCGLDEVWIADEGVAREPFALLSAAAVLTSHITLAVGITSPLLRHPGALASTAATLDELSNGRAVLGLGLGGSESLDPFGIGITRPIAQMDSAITICRGVLNRRAVEGYEPPAHAMPARQVPIWIGARGPQMIRLAARRTDGVFISGCTSAQVDNIFYEAQSVAQTVAQTDAEPVKSSVPFGYALYHSASDLITAETVSTWDQATDHLLNLAADHPVTSLGINLVDLSLASNKLGQTDNSVGNMVERAAQVLTAAAAHIRTRAPR